MFHSTVIPPFVLYSIVPPKQEQGNTEPFLSRPVPGIASAKLMHDFGVSQQHTIVIDLPLSLDQSNLKHNKPVIAYDHTGKTRFGVFPRYSPEVPEWLETEACCIIHTVNSWDEIKGNASNVHMLVCRMNNVSQLYHMGNIEAPVIPNQPEPECRLYYYQFQLEPGSPKIAQQWALSAIPFEFPHVPKGHSMSAAQFVYGCSMRHGNFAGLVVESIKMDCLVKINVQSLLKRAAQNPPTAVSGCVDSRSISQILSSNPIEDDPIQVFSLPDGWYAQECAFVPRAGGISEDDGWLITYVFDESQLDEQGIAPENARSQLWIIDAKGMKDIVARVFLPQRVPYGMHGCWFSEDEILNQLEIQQFRG
jgi:carotenoid cleavage dioxygenase-like enzyme